jgi:hypothetical protein
MTTDPTRSAETMLLPVPGYPASEQSLTAWFRETHGREPSELELGALMAAMAERAATPPLEGPEADPEGWGTATALPAVEG